MSELTDAFEEILDAREEASGRREKVLIQGGLIDALIQTQTDELNPGAGGYSYGEPIRFSVRISDVTLPIDRLESVTVRGLDLAVLSFSPLEGRVDILAGDPTTEVE